MLASANNCSQAWRGKQRPSARLLCSAGRTSWRQRARQRRAAGIVARTSLRQCALRTEARAREGVRARMSAHSCVCWRVGDGHVASASNCSQAWRGTQRSSTVCGPNELAPMRGADGSSPSVADPNELAPMRATGGRERVVRWRARMCVHSCVHWHSVVEHGAHVNNCSQAWRGKQPSWRISCRSRSPGAWASS